MASTPPQSTSLLNLLNPYASVSRSTVTTSDPDSPSTMLLRELTGDDEELEERERMSPTPTPRRTYNSSSNDNDDPSPSIMFGERSGERTPKSPPGPLPTTQPFGISPSPKKRSLNSGPEPFREPLPSSSSTSEPESMSASPGPSTLSIYASGLEGVSIATTSRDPSISPKVPARRAPTFREPPRANPLPGPIAGSGVKKASPRLKSGEGYLDPQLPSPSDRKGKGRTRDKTGRRYHAVSANDTGGDEGEEEGGRNGVERKVGLNEYEKALWKWVNVEDLDGFLQEVYEYYKGKGIYCIALARVLNLLTTFFVIAFSTFLLSCIDYSKLASTTSGPNSIARLDDVLIGQCLTRGSFPHMLFIFAVTGFYMFQLISFAASIPRLIGMYRFYTHLLGVPDADIQTLPWPEIVRLIGEIRKHNPVTSLSNGVADMVGDDANAGKAKKLDAHDVANRILRQENYLIALFNKELLDLRARLPIPHSLVNMVPNTLLAPSTSTALPSHTASVERRYITFGANTLTKALEWNLRFCLMGYLFDHRGQVRKEFVRERRRKDLVEGLRRRIIFMGILNAMFAPFIVVYLLIYSFFRYFEEYHKNPSSIGSRQYTPYAQWKFREFNELPHLFERRLDRSYPTAKEYIDQFPKERTALVMRFVAFIAGSLSAVLLAASLVDPDLFLHFEITPHRTVLFYLGVFGSILAIARGMVPEENLVFDPEMNMREVVRWTHHLPMEWRGKLHSQMVHQQFSQLFALKITIFFTELLSVILTPLVLFFSLPNCSGAIIDFFREFTVHVDGVGYVCSFAVFDFRKHTTSLPPVKSNGNTIKPAQIHETGTGGGFGTPKERKNAWRERDRDQANENKMEKSFLHFKATHPDWTPSEPSASIFLDRLVGLHQNSHENESKSGANGLSGSVFPGGRGLGLEESRLRERSRRYDRAWANSSHLLRPSINGHGRGHGPGAHDLWGQRHAGKGLEIMHETRESRQVSPDGEEEEDEEDGQGEGEEGWRKRVIGDDDEDDEEEEDNEERFMRDVGVVGLLQQVMGRRGG